MQAVIDANVLFAALIRDSHTRHLMTDRNLRLHSPDYLLHEITKHSDIIMAKTGMTRDEMKVLIHSFIAKADIAIVPFQEFEDNMEEAAAISPDPNDTPYLALCIHLKCPLWSNDRILKKQDVVRVLNTEDITIELEA